MDAVKALILGVAVLLSGCGKPPSSNPPNREAASHLMPQDSEIASIYVRSCRGCHTIATTGAPLTGDKAAWAPRMDKGMDELVNSAVNGFGGMPPFGLCMDCSREQFAALIQFMAGGK